MFMLWFSNLNTPLLTFGGSQGDTNYALNFASFAISPLKNKRQKGIEQV